MFDKKFYISTTLPYVNSKPHIGHCFEFVLADFIARHNRNKLGEENVFFNSGIDEHGQKVYNKSLELGKTPQEYCNEMYEHWIDFCEMFQISCNNFYRTTSLTHKESTKKFINLIRPYIYEKPYSGLYCEGCESFKTSKDLIDGRCEQHPTLVPQEISENNFFLKLKELQSCVNPEILFNKELRNEFLSLFENIEDIAISRENVIWGIPFPGSNQTIYVWTEALLNYVFAAGYFFGQNSLNFEEYWKNSLIICGKDNLRFQTIILPCLLGAANIPGPNKVLVHGFILDEEGKKMSKSTGNVIDPVDQLKKFGIDAVRYYLIAGLNTFYDSSYSEIELVNKFNSHIVNGYGNLLARVLHLIDIKKIKIEFIPGHNTSFINQSLKNIDSKIESYDIKEAFNLINDLVTWGNKYITDSRPFAAECENPEIVLSEVYYLLEKISIIYECVFPNLKQKIGEAMVRKQKIILFQKLSTTYENTTG